MMKNRYSLKTGIATGIVGVMLLGGNAFGVSEKDLEEYWPVAQGRAEKIVNNLEIEDKDTRERVSQILAEQYRDLFYIDEVTAEAVQEIEEESGRFDLLAEEAEAGIRRGAEKAKFHLHREFESKLIAVAGPEIAHEVKDGMTYHVAQNTYNVYMDMLPDLDEEQKARIKAWMLEAREHAIDAGSSDAKQKWFGKYKGKINNYLSDLGYDLKQAEREMWERKKKEKE